MVDLDQQNQWTKRNVLIAIYSKYLIMNYRWINAVNCRKVVIEDAISQNLYSSNDFNKILAKHEVLILEISGYNLKQRNLSFKNDNLQNMKNWQ